MSVQFNITVTGDEVAMVVETNGHSFDEVEYAVILVVKEFRRKLKNKKTCTAYQVSQLKKDSEAGFGEKMRSITHREYEEKYLGGDTRKL